MTVPPLIVGLGSPHGDDQAGWLVIARLHAHGIPWEWARPAKHPADLWNWCTRTQALTICDAVCTRGPIGQLTPWYWPRDDLPTDRTGTHDLPLAEALALGVELGSIPDEVTVWTIAGNCFLPGADPQDVVKAAASTLADRLYQELRRA